MLKGTAILLQIFYSALMEEELSRQPVSTPLPTSGTIIVSATLPSAANNTPLLIVRIELTGGQSNGTNLQNVIDNVTIGGTIVPEPATVAGGLLGVLGLCWFQRRRLIGALRLRRETVNARRICSLGSTARCRRHCTRCGSLCAKTLTARGMRLRVLAREDAVSSASSFRRSAAPG